MTRLLLLTLLLLAAPRLQPARAQSLSQQLAKEPAAALAALARERGNAVRGAILFTNRKLGCTNCHAAGAKDLLGPDLTRLGDDATDVHLVESLLAPSKTIRKGYETSSVLTKAGKQIVGRIVERGPERIVIRENTPERTLRSIDVDDVDDITVSKTSTMPDKLVDQLADRGQFFDLVRYTMELAATRAGGDLFHPPGGKVIAPDLRGLVLLKEYNCRACHRDDLPANTLTPKRAPNLAWSSGRIDPRHVERFLADPSTVKPGTTMPDVLGSRPPEERRKIAGDLAHYLATLSDRTFQRQPLDEESAARGRTLFHTVGCVACHSPRDGDGKDLLPQDSVPLGPVERKYNLAGLTAFLENPHASRPSGRMPALALTHWEAIDLGNYLLSRTSEARPAAAAPFVLDRDRAARGKQAFAMLGCVRCHAPTGTTSAEPTSTPLSRVRLDRGCLADAEGEWPRFDLSAEQRTAIRAALRRLPPELTDAQQIDVTLTGFRCLNCHQRGELGGVSEERNPHFRTTNPNLGPQGRIPPTLTNVGAKLNPKWMRQVLVGGRPIRPYVLTRMPRFGTENVEHLVELFGRVDELPEVAYPPVKDVKELRKVGAEMAGTGGLNCIACHTFQLKKAANMPAVDLTEMAERLQKRWFYHYMKNPQRLSHNTVMPSFWPGGRAMRKDILDGRTDVQVEALWQYLLDGRQARTPRGLIREPIELLAKDEAVMLRRSYPGIGKRGIGVGYPNQVNLAFDAEQMQLAMIWQGKFADPGGVWRSQGHGTVRPLGTDLIRFTKGPDLDDADAPWVVDEGRPPQHRFRGYTLDEKQRPRFRYQFGDVRVVDYTVDLVDPSSKRPFLRRTLTLDSPTGRTAVFRAADGKKIVAKGKGLFLVDETLRVRVDDAHTATIVEQADGQRLHVPVRVTGEPSTLVLEYAW